MNNIQGRLNQTQVGQDITFYCRCLWQGRKCSSAQYKTNHTDLGQCVTFAVGSSGDDDSLSTNKTGAGFGLTLTLNIEQYEYIRGPSTDAGIKVGFS